MIKKTVSCFTAAVLLFLSLSLMACGHAGDAVKVIDIKLTSEEYAFAVAKGNTTLLNSLNDFMASIKADGSFDEILEKYFGGGTPTPVVSASRMKNDGSQLIVATKASFAPFEYKSGINYYGIDMEIMALFARHLGRELYIYDMPFDAVCLSVSTEGASYEGTDEEGNPVTVQGGICDIAAAGLTVSDKRREILDFSTPYYDASQVLVCAADDTSFDACTDKESVEAILKTYDRGVRVGVQNGTTGKLYCTGDKGLKFPGYAFHTVGYESGSLAILNVMNGNCKCVILDEGPAKEIVKKINAVN